MNVPAAPSVLHLFHVSVWRKLSSTCSLFDATFLTLLWCNCSQRRHQIQARYKTLLSHNKSPSHFISKFKPPRVQFSSTCTCKITMRGAGGTGSYRELITAGDSCFTKDWHEKDVESRDLLYRSWVCWGTEWLTVVSLCEQHHQQVTGSPVAFHTAEQTGGSQLMKTRFLCGLILITSQSPRHP